MQNTFCSLLVCYLLIGVVHGQEDSPSSAHASAPMLQLMVLAGANRAPAGPDELPDGVLRASEIESELDVMFNALEVHK